MYQLFALLPIIQFITLYTISSKNKRLPMLFNMYAITILDWLFIPFNIILPFAINFSWLLFGVFLLLALLGSSALYLFWHKTRYETFSYFTSKTGISS